MDKIYKALAEVNRRKIVFWLGLGEMTVNKIVEKLELSQGTVSNHLAILKKAGLVFCRVKGKERYYSLNKEKIYLFVKEINRLLLSEEKRLGDEMIIRR